MYFSKCNLPQHKFGKATEIWRHYLLLKSGRHRLSTTHICILQKLPNEVSPLVSEGFPRFVSLALDFPAPPCPEKATRRKGRQELLLARRFASISPPSPIPRWWIPAENPNTQLQSAKSVFRKWPPVLSKRCPRLTASHQRKACKLKELIGFRDSYQRLTHSSDN